MPDLREPWRTGRLEATVYDTVVEHERLARPLGWLAWGTDTSGFYRELARLADEPDGTSVLDIPCGGGVAFRGLRPAQRIRYVAADLSPLMLGRARSEAARRGLEFIEFVEADVEALPFADSAFDLCITYTGLHCFPAPARALEEMTRVLRPGGELRGTCVTKNAGLRQEALVRLMQVTGVFGPGLTHTELEEALEAAGLGQLSVDHDGALAYFSARASR